MSEHKLPQETREARGLVGIKTAKIPVYTFTPGTPLTPGSSKWYGLLQQAKAGGGLGVEMFYATHGRLRDLSVFSGDSLRSVSVSPQEEEVANG